MRIEFAKQLRDADMQLKAVIIEADKVKLRPIMLTMESTILGGVPLILLTGAAAEARNTLG